MATSPIKDKLVLKNFKGDYLSLLHSRPKWRNSSKNLKVDNLVILVDDSSERNLWKMGRIVGTPTTNGHVRRVEVMRSDGKIVSWDRVKVVKMEMDE